MTVLIEKRNESFIQKLSQTDLQFISETKNTSTFSTTRKNYNSLVKEIKRLGGNEYATLCVIKG